MTGKGLPLVIYPRFSALVGFGTYNSLPIEVSPYSGATLSVWRARLAGTTPTFGMAFQESLDRITWTSCLTTPSPTDPGEFDEKTYEIVFFMSWFRMVVVLGGTSPGATLWAMGTLVKREE